MEEHSTELRYTTAPRKRVELDDDLNLVVYEDGVEFGRLPPQRWRADDQTGDRSARLSRHLKGIGMTMSPERRAALIKAYDEKRAAAREPSSDATALDEAIAAFEAGLAALKRHRDSL